MKKFSLFLIFFSFFVFADELNESFAAAVQAGNVKTATEVFAKGADINFVDEDWPLFVTAVTSGDVAMTEFFIKNGVNLELKGPDGKTALLHAISLKNKKIVDMLLAAGAEIKTEDAAGKDTLMYAVKQNLFSVVKKLLELGADPTLRQVEGKTALDIAKSQNNQSLARILSEAEKKWR
ncbi:ankyrin repeat domain-containing protein [bacterium]|nr:ankyrin repeat domain-containing protein [bacterium]